VNRKLCRVVFIAASLAALLGIGYVEADGRVQQGATGALAGSDVEMARTFRQEMGFPSTDEILLRAADDPVAYPNLDYGVPLSVVEGNEVDRRIRLQHDLQPARKYAAESSDAAGTYFDNLSGGVPVFLFTGDLDRHRSDLAWILPPGQEYTVQIASVGWDDLVALRDSITDGFDILKSAGVNISLAGIDPRVNAVVVGITGLSDEDVAIVGSRFSGPIVFRDEAAHVADSCISRSNCPPLKGGIKITSVGFGWCTSGWIVKLDGTSSYRVLTAGHCIDLGGDLNHDWTHNGVVFGQSKVETWYNHSTADGGLISVSVAGQGPRNLFYASSATDIRQVTEYEVFQNVGDTVCRGGAKTEYRCGDIRLVDVNRNVDGNVIEHSNEVSFDASPGDSGAPMFAGPSALGIHTDSTDDAAPLPHYGWYSKIDWLKNEMLGSKSVLFKLCLDADCVNTY
jgi:hypothetical protein